MDSTTMIFDDSMISKTCDYHSLKHEECDVSEDDDEVAVIFQRNKLNLENGNSTTVAIRSCPSKVEVDVKDEHQKDEAEEPVAESAYPPDEELQTELNNNRKSGNNHHRSNRSFETPEERKARLTVERHQRLASMSTEELAEYRRKTRTNSLRRLARMTAEQRQEHNRKRRVYSLQRLARMSAEELAEYRRRTRTNSLRRLARMTAEQRQEYYRKRRVYGRRKSGSLREDRNDQVLENLTNISDQTISSVEDHHMVNLEDEEPKTISSSLSPETHPTKLEFEVTEIASPEGNNVPDFEEFKLDKSFEVIDDELKEPEYHSPSSSLSTSQEVKPLILTDDQIETFPLSQIESHYFPLPSMLQEEMDYYFNQVPSEGFYTESNVLEVFLANFNVPEVDLPEEEDDYGQSLEDEPKVYRCRYYRSARIDTIIVSPESIRGDRRIERSSSSSSDSSSSESSNSGSDSFDSSSSGSSSDSESTSSSFSYSSSESSSDSSTRPNLTVRQLQVLRKRLVEPAQQREERLRKRRELERQRLAQMTPEELDKHREKRRASNRASKLKRKMEAQLQKEHRNQKY